MSRVGAGSRRDSSLLEKALVRMTCGLSWEVVKKEAGKLLRPVMLDENVTASGQ